MEHGTKYYKNCEKVKCNIKIAGAVTLFDYNASQHTIKNHCGDIEMTQPTFHILLL